MLTCLKKKGGGGMKLLDDKRSIPIRHGGQRRGLMSEILSSSAGGNLRNREWGLGLQSVDLSTGSRWF